MLQQHNTMQHKAKKQNATNAIQCNAVSHNMILGYLKLTSQSKAEQCEAKQYNFVGLF